MSKTHAEIEADYAKLAEVAEQWGVRPSSLAQFCDMAGSYGNLTQEESGVPRRLPPRASMNGILLASNVSQVLGTSKVRAIVNRYQKLQRESTTRT